jgi:RNA polymerase sigma-70 factor (ECF subfamily)
VGDIHLAEELTEDTFFKLLSRKPRFEHRSSFKTWLYTIAHNTAIDYIRHTHRELPTADMQQSLPGADMETLERAYLKADQKIMVHRMLARLDPRHAQVLHLCYFEELDYAQIGQIMHLSTRQVTNLLYRARQKLKTELEKAGFEYEEQ